LHHFAVNTRKVESANEAVRRVMVNTALPCDGVALIGIDRYSHGSAFDQLTRGRHFLGQAAVAAIDPSEHGKGLSDLGSHYPVAFALRPIKRGENIKGERGFQTQEFADSLRKSAVMKIRRSETAEC